MLTPERIKQLRFMADNGGCTQSRIEQMEKAGTPAHLRNNGHQVVLSTAEVRELLDVYEARNGG